MNRAIFPAEVDDLTRTPEPQQLGALVGVEMLRMAWMAHHMGVEFDVLADWDDEVCPPFPQVPTIPAHVWPLPIDDVDDAWVVQYHHGLADTLDRARGWVRNAPIVVEAHDKALRAIAAAG